MTVVASPVLSAQSRLREWLSARHSLLSEALVVVGLYATYELARGLVAGDGVEAEHHARRVVALERSLHVFVEGDVQRFAHHVPALVAVLGGAYLTMHLTVSAGALLWLHRRRPAGFALARTALLLASALALVGYLVYPTAPPRLAGIGIADTISNRSIDLDHGLVSFVYNPYAAVPSMHIGYALIIAATVVSQVRSSIVRALALVYPLVVLLVIVATGNHFFFAAAGAAVAVVAAAAAVVLTRRSDSTMLVTLPQRNAATSDRRAA